MFCPKCRSEYRPGFEQCKDCGIALVAVLPNASKGPSGSSVWDEPESLETPDTLAGLTAEIAQLVWIDSEFLFLREESDSLILEIKQGNGEPLRMIFVEHIAIQHLGHWGMNMIKSATVSDNSPLIVEAQNAITNRYGKSMAVAMTDPDVSDLDQAVTFDSTDPWFCFRLTFLDDCELQIVFHKIEIDKM
jgi:hypothetical protein